MGFFLFKALGWASFRDGLLFFLRSSDELLFEIIFANSKHGLLSR